MECVTKFLTSIFFHDSNPPELVINRLKYFRIKFRFPQEIRSQNSKNSTPWCAWHRGVKILGLANQNFFLHNFSFMIDVFTPKRISPDCPFKRNQRLTKISILTPQCAVWLHGGMHTAELELAVGCTPRSLTPWWDAHPWVRLVRICPFFMFSYL